MVFNNDGNAYEDFFDVQELNSFIRDFDKISKAKMMDMASAIDVTSLNYLILELTTEQLKFFFKIVYHNIPIESFLWMEYSAKVRLFNILSSDVFVNLLTVLEVPDIVLFIEDFDDVIKDRILSLLPSSICDMVLKRMKYPEDTAGRIMRSNYVILYDSQTLSQALLTIKEYKLRDSYQIIAVLDLEGMFKGVILLQDLLKLQSNKKVGDLTYLEHSVDANDRLEATVAIFKSYSISAIPVLSEGRIVGVISIQHVVNFIQYENEEDLMNISGVNVHSASMSISSGVYVRLPSLLINLLMAFGISFVTSKFDILLQYYTTVAFLLNVIPSIAGALAIQTMSVTIQSISKGFINHKNYNQFIVKEVVISMWIAFIMMFFGIGISWFLFNHFYLSFYFGISIFITLICVGFIGASMPIFLEYLGLDSSVSSGAVIATFTDVLAYLIFLIMSYKFLLFFF
ncbi:MAG: magnesium transporter [Pseudomonadota bacterium]